MTIGEKIQALRKSKGLSQEQLAENLDISRQAVSKWEAEQSVPEIDKIIALADFFGVSTDYLLRDTEKSQQEKVEPQIINEPPAEEKQKEEKNRKASTLLFTIAIMLYILCPIPLFVLQNEIGLVLLLVIVAAATGLMIYRAVFNTKSSAVKAESYESTEKQEQKSEENPVLKIIKSTITTVFVITYFIVSFVTGAWHITWIMFPISGIIKRMVDTVFELKEINKK